MNPDYPVVISFYTPNWEYPTYAAKLRADCDRLGLDHHIVEFPDTGDWGRNTRAKPQFIYDTMEELKRPVLWVDATSSILQLPTLFKANCRYEVAFHEMNQATRTPIWHVGTMYIRYTSNTIQLVKQWADKTATSTSTDELTLDALWKERPPVVGWLAVGALPVTYFKMLPTPEEPCPEDTVICHRVAHCPGKVTYVFGTDK